MSVAVACFRPSAALPNPRLLPLGRTRDPCSQAEQEVRLQIGRQRVLRFRHGRLLRPGAGHLRPAAPAAARRPSVGRASQPRRGLHASGLAAPAGHAGLARGDRGGIGILGSGIGRRIAVSVFFGGRGSDGGGFDRPRLTADFRDQQCDGSRHGRDVLLRETLLVQPAQRANRFAAIVQRGFLVRGELIQRRDHVAMFASGQRAAVRVTSPTPGDANNFALQAKTLRTGFCTARPGFAPTLCDFPA